MPGRLIMEQHGMMEPSNLKKDRSKAQEAGLLPKPDFSQHPHGVNGSLPNGIPSHGDVPVLTNGQTGKSTGAGRTPPPLDQSWRETPANRSMGMLINRLAHQCFEDLSNQITKMAEEPAMSQDQNVVARVDDPAIRKKRGFMEFAKNQRDLFIKTLVLSDWARHAGEDMARLVDIKLWQEQQSGAQHQAITSIGVTKHNVAPTKLPSPNIEGAMQLLSTGKASSKVPDLGYGAPRRLTAQQLLRTLQGMNVTLITRLNLCEELPPCFNDYSVANGRATFRVQGEFDVDLSLADEDPRSPFYFIDIRFTFTPAPESLDEAIRGQLEVRTNTELATKGLQGCFDFLHNYVLTLKINTLRSQVQTLRADQWFDGLHLEWKHRVLTVQYWQNQPGKKNWLEFGIGTGKKLGVRSRRPITPQINVRWFRKGHLIEHDKFDIDWTNINAESIISKVIAKHATWYLNQIEEGLRRIAGANSRLSIDLTSSEMLPAKCSLSLRLPSMHAPFVVCIEPVTGWVSISPSADRVIASERVLNSDTNAEPSRVLAYLLCKTVEDRVGRAIELSGWSAPEYRFIKQDNFQTLFGVASPSWKPYRPPDWDKKFIVIVLYSLSGESWWVAHLQRRDGATGNSPVDVISDARHIDIANTLVAGSTITRSAMLQIEKLAAAEVSFMMLSHELNELQIPFRLEKQAMLTAEDPIARLATPPTMAIFFSGAALKDAMGKAIAVNFVKITYQGLDSQNVEGRQAGNIQQRLWLIIDTGKLTRLKEYLATKSYDDDIAMTSTGALALRLASPFGQPYLELIFNKLWACERLEHYLTTLQRFQFHCTCATLHKIAFTYGRSAELSASFSFASGGLGLPAVLTLEPSSSNPHNRTRVMLQSLFNNRNLKDQFSIFCKALCYSVGAMNAFEKIEVANRSTNAVSIHPRHPLLFTIVYKAPLASLSFTVELRERKERQQSVVAWKIQAQKSKQELGALSVGKSIFELAKQTGHGWFGFEDGTFTAAPHGVTDLLEKLDKIMRSSASSPVGTANPGDAANTNVRASQAAQKTTQQQQDAQLRMNDHKAQVQKLQQHKPNGLPTVNGPRTMTVGAKPSTKPSAPTGGQAKVKKEVIELD